MIKAKTLIALLQQCDPDSAVSAYEGEDVGLNITEPTGAYRWIRATGNKHEDAYTDGFRPLEVPE